MGELVKQPLVGISRRGGRFLFSLVFSGRRLMGDDVGVARGDDAIPVPSATTGPSVLPLLVSPDSLSVAPDSWRPRLLRFAPERKGKGRGEEEARGERTFGRLSLWGERHEEGAAGEQGEIVRLKLGRPKTGAGAEAAAGAGTGAGVGTLAGAVKDSGRRAEGALGSAG